MVGDETVATGIRNGTKTVVEGGVSLHVRFSFSHIVHNMEMVRMYLHMYPVEAVCANKKTHSVHT